MRPFRSTLCHSPLPPRECNNMLRTMPSARRPCSAIFPRLPVSIWIVSSISARLSPSSLSSAGAAASFSSSSSSTDRLAKLLTKLSGFLISWALPADAERVSHVADGYHLRQSVIPVGGKILDLHHRQPLRCPSDNAAASGLEDKVLSDRSELRREGEGRDRPIHIAIAFGDHSHFSAAEPGSGFDHGIQNRLQIEGRAADDLEDITRRHLIFEGLAQLLCRVAECRQRARHCAHLVRPGRR